MTEAAVAQRPELFCKSVPYLQRVWDSTSYGLLLDCPRKYYFTMILGYQKHPLPAPLWFGIFMHRGIETLIKAKAAGSKTPLLDAVKLVLKETWGYEPEGDNARTRYTLIRALVWYSEHYKDSPAETIIMADGKPAAELSFRFPFPLDNPDGEPYLLSGHMDGLIRFAKQVWVNEVKTTVAGLNDQYFKRYTPDTQVSWYTLASSVALSEPAEGVMIDAIQTGVNFTRFQRGPVPRTKEVMDEWTKDMRIQLQIAEQYAKAEYWPGNDKSCTKFGGCTFQDVCGKSPSVRRNFLNAEFKVRPWNPLANR